MYRIHCAAKFLLISALILALAPTLHALDSPKAAPPNPGEPTDPKAIKTFADAVEWQKRDARLQAVGAFMKANKQDGGHCSECLLRAYQLAVQFGDFKDAGQAARDWLPIAQTDEERAGVHYRIAFVLQQEGMTNKKDQLISESCDEFKTALDLNPQYAAVHYSWGVSLANLHQDDAARAQFTEFIQKDMQHPILHQRAERFLNRIDLARARMAPAFALTTLDGQRVSMDSLAGKVVLIDFWATWCGPCREALPHMRDIAHKFQGQPFVMLSVSLDEDKDIEKWRSFVNKNEMTWLQYRDGGFDGPVSKLFGVTAIPATFTIDADGVLEDQHVGDASIEGKLKKLIAQANDLANQKAQKPADDKTTAAN